jgi:O-antigen ligase
MSDLILIAFLAAAAVLIRRDTAVRDGISAAVWIPTLWVGILASRPVSAWLGFGGGVDPLEGSPIDRLFFFGSIVVAFVIVFRRRPNWMQLVQGNWGLLLYYGFFLISILWAESSVVSGKRWIKDFGNIFVALVILTEVNPGQAFRAVFFRCGCVLLPLSVIFIRYFPNLGRQYSVHSGGLEVTGVTMQKNSLGAMALVCGLGLIWDWFDRTGATGIRLKRFDRYLPAALFAIAVYLLWICDSKTSIACLFLGGLILFAGRLPILRTRVSSLGLYVLAAAAGYFVLDQVFGIEKYVVESMGRDMTFTGRTEVWKALLALKTDPIFGTGFCSIWSDASYRSRLPEWVASSAHNGYLETYLDGGLIAVFFLGLFLVVTAFRINRQLGRGGAFALMRLAVLVAIVVGDLSESHFARMSPLWFMFLVVAIDPRSVSIPSEPRPPQAGLRQGDWFVPQKRPALATEGFAR